MSSKRVKSQITKDDVSMNDDYSRDDEDDVMDVPKRASEETLAKRKIIAFKPLKRSNVGGTPFTPAVPQDNSSSSAPANPFSGFSSTSSTPTAGAPPANPFGFLKKSEPVVPKSTPVFSSTTTAVSSSSSFNTAATTNTTLSPEQIKANKLKSLNSNFVSSLSTLISKNPVADLNDSFNKYNVYLKEINSQTTVPPASKPVSVPITPAVEASSGNTESSSSTAQDVSMKSDSDSDSESEEEEIKIQGPTFNLAPKDLPKSKDYGFVFGKKVTTTRDPDDSDSDEEIEIKGPSFKLAANTEIKDSVFKFPVASKKQDDKATTSAPTFSFSATPTEKKEDTKPAPAFSFGQPTNPAEAKEDSKPTAKPFTFSFDAAKKEETKPVVSTPAPTFNFGASSSSTTTSTEKKDEVSKPAFGGFSAAASPFGFATAPKLAEDNKSASVPATVPASTSTSFSFGKPTITNEGSEKTEEVKASAPVASFGSFGSVPSSTFTGFGQSKASDGSKTETKSDVPTFSFVPPAAKSSDPAPPSSTPAFNFGSGNNNFTFGSSSLTSTTTDQTKPVSSPFSFGAPQPASTAPSGGLFNFNFSAPTNTPLSTGTSASATPVVAAAATTAAATEGEEEPESHDVKGDFAVVKLTEKIETATGEENETVEYTKRAKVMKFDPSNKANPYETLGVGELRILKDKVTSKSRILVRTDGSLNILLNCHVSSAITYDTFGNGTMVKVPVPNADGKIDTYLLRVKTAGDASELLSKINDSKS